MKEITPETNLLELLESGDAVVEAFKRLGLKCPDCIAVEVETVRHAALYHGKDLGEILEALNAALRRAGGS